MEFGLEDFVDGGGDVFDGGDGGFEFGDFEVEVFVVEAGDDVFGDDFFEGGDVDEEALFVGAAAEGHLQFVVVAMAVGVGALAEGFEVQVVGEIGVEEAVGGGEFEFLVESGHGELRRNCGK